MSPPLLAWAASDFAELTSIVVSRWTAADPLQRNVAALDTTRLLMRLGDLLCGWLLLRSAVIAKSALATADVPDREFYQGKAAVGPWFARTVLPTISADLAAAHLTTSEINDLPHSAL